MQWLTIRILQFNNKHKSVEAYQALYPDFKSLLIKNTAKYKATFLVITFCNLPV